MSRAALRGKKMAQKDNGNKAEQAYEDKHRPFKGQALLFGSGGAEKIGVKSRAGCPRYDIYIGSRARRLGTVKNYKCCLN